MSRPREDKNPVVIGRLGRLESRPTITFYGHYDVQPAMEREWATDPFQVHAEDGYFYGRGTSDNKATPPYYSMVPPCGNLSKELLNKWLLWSIIGSKILFGMEPPLSPICTGSDWTCPPPPSPNPSV